MLLHRQHHLRRALGDGRRIRLIQIQQPRPDGGTQRRLTLLRGDGCSGAVRICDEEERPVPTEVQVLHRFLPQDAVGPDGGDRHRLLLQPHRLTDAVQILHAGTLSRAVGAQQQPQLRGDGEPAAGVGAQYPHLPAGEAEPCGVLAVLRQAGTVQYLGQRQLPFVCI